MAKKNRPARPALGTMYLSKGEEIPGCNGRLAEKDGWYDPDYEPDFSWKQYREWERKRNEAWAIEQSGAVQGIIMNP